jgi:hypothetical protein
METHKKTSRGGGELLKKHGPDYFSELAKKGAAERKVAMEYYKKSKQTKNNDRNSHKKTTGNARKAK